MARPAHSLLMYNVIETDGTVREFFCRFRAQEHAAKHEGSVIVFLPR